MYMYAVIYLIATFSTIALRVESIKESFSCGKVNNGDCLNMYNEPNATQKVLCEVFTHPLFLYQKSQLFAGAHPHFFHF